jgi:RimJ/RimL family protein N-acetyltransferase
MSDDAWPLRTDRLEIRRCTVDDLDAMWEYWQRPEVNRLLGRAPGTREAFIETFSAPDRLAMTYAIDLLPGEEQERPVLIGDVMVRIEDGWAQAEVTDQVKDVQAELGWVLHPDHSGKGYATEAIRAVIGACFGPLGLRRVHAGCFAANEPSWRLMERLGMRREEFSRKTALHRSGEWMDGLNYGLLAEEWPTPSAR